MASGKKNYFRHFAGARHDSKIVNLVTKYGKETYFHYFALLEMCAEKALAEDLSGDEEFVFHKRTVCNELMVTPWRLGGHLLAIQSSLLGDLVVTSDQVKIKFPNLRKYLGRYENKKVPNSPKEIKGNKRKENTINSPILKTAFYEVEKPSLEESEKVLPTESNILTHLNAVCLSSYRPGKKTISLIKARLAEGFTFDDFKRVIDFKNEQWKNSEMANYLRPETLFGNKFEGYLQASKQVTGPMSESEALKLAEKLYSDAFGKKED
jgi:uncharacterized phage protein (TIGR02220 family)